MGQRLVRMELKYCEGCGGLLLRRSGEAVVYCGPCDMKLRELPSAGETVRPDIAERDQAGAGVIPEGPRKDAVADAFSAVRIPPQRETLDAVHAVEHRRQA